MSSSGNRSFFAAPAKAVFLSWWHVINSETAGGTARADRAVLRRADTLTAVACTPAYQRIYRKMAAANTGPSWQAFEQERIAAMVGLAAHVKDKDSRSLPQAMSSRAAPTDPNPVSDMRFARLLDSPDIEALFSGLRRALPLIEHKVDPASLADDLFDWGDHVKKRWAYAYAWTEKANG